MDDISEILAQVLSDNDAMAQIQGMISALGLGDSTTSETSPNPENNSGLGDLLGILGLGNNPSHQNNLNPDPSQKADINSNLLGTLGQMIGAYQKADKNETLLLALKPYLKENRQNKIEEAIKIMKLLRLWPFLRQSGLLENWLGGGKHE